MKDKANISYFLQLVLVIQVQCRQNISAFKKLLYGHIANSK